MSTITVANAAQLTSALAKAKDGDRIELAPGKYGSVVLADRDFQSNLTIASQDPSRPAEFNKLSLVRLGGVTVEHVDVIGTDLRSSAKSNRVEILSSHDVTLRHTTIDGYVPTLADGVDPATSPKQSVPIAGYGYDKGLAVRWSQNISIEDVEMKDLFVAAYFEKVKNSSITNSEFHNVREGIDITDIQGLDIKDNYFHDFQEYFKDHVDMIQYWGVNGTWGVHDVTIADNLFHQPAGGDTQTIFGHLNGNTSITATDFTITGNTIINAHPHGIRLADVDGAVISENVLLPNSPSVPWGWYPSIRLPNSTDVTVSSNVVVKNASVGTVTGLTAAQMAAANITEAGNMVLSHVSSSPIYWGNLPMPPYNDPQYNDAEIILAKPGYSAALQSGSAGSSTTVPDTSDPSANDPASSIAVITGSAGNNSLRATNGGASINGLAGSNSLYERQGDDVLEGGAGADTFFFDYRSGMKTDQYDVILDLDFSQGDRIALIGSEAIFDNAGDPGNWLTITNDRAGVHLRDISDIEEAILSGAISYEESDTDTLILLPYQQPNRSIEIATLSASDLFA